MRSVKEIKAEIKTVRAEMKDTGVKRTSCFNGGHSPASYRLNAEMFRLECELKDAQAREAVKVS